ncbi:hypothetical protein, partial [Cellulomonas sp. HZM]|uniref:hypothetical protein n=1 Tax=Cellulomonas sp. HZM TaxID=1454010 RepID=UPI00049393DB
MTRRQLLAALAAGLVVGVVVFSGGMRLGSAALLALTAAGVAVVVTRIDSEDEPLLTHQRRTRVDGVRGDVQDLAWGAVGRDGRLGERALRRLRETATVRLARHGVDLADPADAERARALVGPSAYATCTSRGHPRPSFNDARRAVEALERLGPTPSTPST